jgi:hypothetical protein
MEHILIGSASPQLPGIRAGSLCAAAFHAQAEDAFHPFFVFKNGMENKVEAVEDQAAMLAEFGFDGIDHRERIELDRTLKALDKYGLKLFTIYFKVDIDNPENPYNEGLPEALPPADCITRLP